MIINGSSMCKSKKYLQKFEYWVIFNLLIDKELINKNFTNR